jgi:hypothetical protein
MFTRDSTGGVTVRTRTFVPESTATGKVARVLGHRTFGSGGAFADLLWSNASGSVLIGVIPGQPTTRGSV